MSALMYDHIQEAIDQISEWDVPESDLSHLIADTANALAGRWIEDDDLTVSIHLALHG